MKIKLSRSIGSLFGLFLFMTALWVSGLVPHVLSFAVFVAGAILLFSGTTPEGSWRLMQLEKFLPLPVLEISHFLGSLAGMGLLILSRGLQRRLDAAYVFTIVLLAGGAVFSLLKGLDYEDAVMLLVMLAVLLSCRRHFYRKASIFSQSFDAEWVILITIVLICSVWLGMFSYKHVEYSGDLWWRFREICDHYDGHLVFYKVGPEKLFLYLDIGLTLLKLGEEALVDSPSPKYPAACCKDERQGEPRRSSSERRRVNSAISFQCWNGYGAIPL